MKYIPTNDNVSDIFTKALPRPKYQKMVEMLGLARIDETCTPKRATQSLARRLDDAKSSPESNDAKSSSGLSAAESSSWMVMTRSMEPMSRRVAGEDALVVSNTDELATLRVDKSLNASNADESRC